jgi:hypothetical protein
MEIRIHPHAAERAIERGATEQEIQETLSGGEHFPAKHGRSGFRRNFSFDSEWNGKWYASKQIEAYAVEEDGWLVITVIVKYF